ncbi:MAG TPA: hypothetical protein VD833_09215 [Vicinamibacterales bacterium]|nr:hypothetical protein [Vicinamibacterales bacterium]
MRIPCILIVSALTCATLPTPTAAQTWPERVLLTVNGGVQTASNRFDDRFDFQEYLETATTAVDYESEGGPVFDAGVGIRLWRGLGAGVAVSAFTKENAAQTRSSIPHPFFDSQPRQADGAASGLKRTETAVHVQAMYLIDPAGPLRLVLFAGPSFFRIEQDVVTGIRYAESYPYDTATFSAADTTALDASAVGFNAGADVMWMVHSRIGLGALLRFTRASIDLAAPGRTIGVDAGGLQGGGGIRLIF